MKVLPLQVIVRSEYSRESNRLVEVDLNSSEDVEVCNLDILESVLILAGLEGKDISSVIRFCEKVSAEHIVDMITNTRPPLAKVTRVVDAISVVAGDSHERFRDEGGFHT